MINKTKILLVEDDTNFGSMLKSFLELHDFEVVLRSNGKQGGSAFRTEPFDLLILDVMMPEKDGFSLAAEVRESGSTVPVIFLTAKNMREDVIRGFRLGADDYITKPFDSEILILRIKALLKRGQGKEDCNDHPPEVFCLGTYQFFPKIRLLKSAKEERTLTSREADLLKMLCMARGGVLLRREALQKIWGDDTYFNTRSMDVFVARLRKYLKDDPGIQIMNIHSHGFRLILPANGDSPAD